LRWCAPALLAGLVLRIALTVELPFAVYHGDTSDLLETPDRLLAAGKFSLHGKKTFLTPLFVTAHCLLPLPAMATIPFTQHVLGLGSIVLVGLLVRLWFAQWKFFLAPLTVLYAVNPYVVWFEHTIMAETLYLVCTLLLVCAGALYALAPTSRRFAFLCAALFLEAGARPEGKLLFGFAALLLALVHWPRWRAAARRFALLLALGVVTHFLTRTGQGGLLLYTSVAWLTPLEPRCAPGFEAHFAPVRAELEQRRREGNPFPGARQRGAIMAAMKSYLAAQPAPDGGKRPNPEEMCQRLARETILRNPEKMPGWLLQKFARTAAEAASGALDAEWLGQRQEEAMLGEPEMLARMAPRLYGVALDAAAVPDFLRRHYEPVEWFNAWREVWTRSVAAVRVTPLRLPLCMALAALGLVAAMARHGGLRRFHFAWGLALAAHFAVIMLTANVRPRFRFVFEPFWFLYAALLVQVLWSAVAARRRG
jgi:hypothetical protein